MIFPFILIALLFERVFGGRSGASSLVLSHILRGLDGGKLLPLWRALAFKGKMAASTLLVRGV